MSSDVMLATISPSGMPPRSVIQDGQSAHEVKRRLITADIGRSRQRVVLKQNYDGHPPYDPAELKKRNLADMSNTNMKRMKALTDTQVDSYLDNQFETVDQATAVIEFGTGTKGHDFSQIITDEFNRTITRWKGNYSVSAKSNFNRVFYGYGTQYFEDDINWRPIAADAGQILVDKDADTDLHNLDILCIRRTWRLHQLYRMIQNPSKSEKLGWNVDATRKAIIVAASNHQELNYTTQLWETWNNRLKGNDIYMSYVSPGAVCYDLLTKEYDGTISRRLLTENDSGDVLFTKYNVAKEFREVVCPFFLSQQESLWHSIRGLGAQLYNVLKQLDKVDNRIFDMTMIGGSLVIQPQTAAAYDKLNALQLGPVTVLPPGTNYINTAFPNLSQGGIVTHNMLMQALSQTSGEYMAAAQSTQTGEAPTATQNNNDLAMMGRLSSSQNNQFFNELDNRCLQMFKRLSNPNLPDPSTPRGKSEWCREARDFQKRCRDRGVPMGALQEPYLQSVTANRAMGHGSAQARSQQANELLNLLPLVPNQQSRELVIKDAFTAKFGSTASKRYFPAVPGRELREDAKTAQLENAGMESGYSFDVMDYENAVTHLDIHLPLLQQTTQSLTQASGQEGQAPNMGAIGKVYGLLAVALPHCNAHLQTIAGDRTQKDYVNSAVNVLRQLNSTASHLQFQLKTAASAQQRAAIAESMQQTQDAAKLQLDSQKLALAARKQAHKEQVDGVKLQLDIAKTKQELVAGRQNLHLNDLGASLDVLNSSIPQPQSQQSVPTNGL